MQMREKVGKSRNTMFFQWFVAPEGRQVGSLKRRVRSQLARWEMKNCTPLWREAHFEVKMYKTPQPRTSSGSWDVEKVHAVVARSTFRSQNVQNTLGPDHFWKLRCRKSARRCGAKQISKSKCTKHLSLGPLLEVQMSKKCTLLWREAHFEVKMVNWRFRCRFAWQAQGIVHVVKSEQNVKVFSIFKYNHHYTTLYSNTLQLQLKLHLHYIPLHSTTLHCTQLHSITLHYITLHFITAHYTTLHNTPLH